MKLSPLVLKTYIVLELQVAANLQFNPGKALELSTDDLRIHVDLAPSTRPEDQWQLVLQIQHIANPKRNYTYAFALKMIGFLDMNEKVPEADRDKLLRVNGASMLYGAAREIIRSATAQGPYNPVLIPSVSFYPKADTSTRVAEESIKKSS